MGTYIRHPLLEFFLTELYDEKENYFDFGQQRSRVNFEIYKQMQGLNGAIVKRAEDTLKELDEKAIKEFDFIFRQLITNKFGNEEEFVSKLEFYENITNTKERKSFVDKFKDARLFVTDIASN